MERVFVDSGVVYEAILDSASSSRALCIQAAEGKIQILTGPFDLEKVKQNIEQQAGINQEQLLELLGHIVRACPLFIIKVLNLDVAHAAQQVELAKAPTLAAARNGAVKLYVTKDADLIGEPSLAQYIGADIVDPDDALSRL